MKQLITILFLFLFSYSIFAQNTQTNDWIRVQSDNGNISFLVPPIFNYFFSDKGITSKQGFTLSKMNLIRGYSEGTLVSFESYNVSKSFLDEFIMSDSLRNSGRDIPVSNNRRDGVDFKQLEKQFDDSYLIRRYFYFDKWIFIFTVASRKGKTAVMDKFLESIQFNSTGANIDASIAKISSLTKTPLEIVSKDVTPLDNSEKSDKKRPSPLLVIRPRAYHTETSRENRITGTVRLRYNCLETGFVNKIEVISSLPHGLTLQVISSLIKSVILPAEVDNKPIKAQKILEYTFTFN